MVINLSSTLPARIRFLIQSLNEANSDSIFQELCELIDHGIEGSVLTLQACLEILFSAKSEVELVLSSIFKYLLEKPNFGTMFSQSLRFSEIHEHFLEQLSNVLQLSLLEKIGIGLALSDSENIETRMCGKRFCMAHVEELCTHPVSVKSAEQIQGIVLFLQRSAALSNYVDRFMQMVSLIHSEDVIPFVLTPLLPDELHQTNFLRNMDLLIFFSGIGNGGCL